MANLTKTFSKTRKKRKGRHSKNASGVNGHAKSAGLSNAKKAPKKYIGQGR